MGMVGHHAIFRPAAAAVEPLSGAAARGVEHQERAAVGECRLFRGCEKASAEALAPRVRVDEHLADFGAMWRVGLWRKGQHHGAEKAPAIVRHEEKPRALAETGKLPAPERAGVSMGEVRHEIDGRAAGHRIDKEVGEFTFACLGFTLVDGSYGYVEWLVCHRCPRRVRPLSVIACRLGGVAGRVGREACGTAAQPRSNRVPAALNRVLSSGSLLARPERTAMCRA
ncbi:hypothetical protein CHELA20_52800 [Hyphomicrobiales bacterium]|nr:hypothetical protein CHELA41_22125 [Hyphomicrobiales bacterium]CAH1682958.1 hypothetical protein CHELA20_52800 [Hyphomicrobiales bacterium]